MAHSKRNTSLAFFTAHERAELQGWGRQRTRLTRESFLPLAACALCLRPAREPVACAHGGHVFCRECALANLLAQRADIARVERELVRARRDDEARARERGAEERERVVEEFERVASGTGGAGGNGAVGPDGMAEREGEEDAATGTRGVKRKFEIDEDEMLRRAKDDRSRARRLLEEEKARKPTLPSFWIPFLTPSSDAADARPPKLAPICPASDLKSPHPLSLKTLITVNFSTPEPVAPSEAKPRLTQSSQAQPASFICPSCKKGLSVASKAMLTVPCGHVICKPCVEQFMGNPEPSDPHGPDATVNSNAAPPLLCLVCETDLSEGRPKKKRKAEDRSAEGDKQRLRPGLVQLSSEGTGFAGGGKNMVDKEGIAFQC